MVFVHTIIIWWPDEFSCIGYFYPTCSARRIVVCVTYVLLYPGSSSTRSLHLIHIYLRVAGIDFDEFFIQFLYCTRTHTLDTEWVGGWTLSRIFFSSLQ